jgi:hypothetical protein
MQLTRIRSATSTRAHRVSVARAAALALCTLGALVTSTGACGQVTGLSNDYLFDLQPDGGAALDASGEASADGGPKTDAPTDAPTDVRVDTGVDAATCSLAQAQSTDMRLSQINGADECKQCLANDCCNAVDSCLNVSECRRALSCRLDCTTLTGTDRHSCFNTCNSNTGGNTTPASYTSGVGACAASACAAPTACAFQ